MHNKHSLALGLALAGLAAASQAQGVDLTWYGRADLTVESNNNGALSRTLIQNFSSRLGVRAERKFGADLSGVIQIETGVAPDDTAQSKTFASRNSYVGLKSLSTGTIIVGTHDMPLKTLEGTAYALWAEGDLQELIIHGKASRASLGNAVFNNVHTRQTNVLLYTSPKLADAVVAKLAYSPDESKTAATSTAPAISKPVTGASVEYNDGKFNAGVAIQSQKNFIAPTLTTAGADMKGTKFTAGMKQDAWTAGVALSKLDNSAGRKTTNWLVTGTYAVNSAITVKASLAKAGESASGADDSTRALALEADYILDKAFTVYGYYTKLSNGTKAKAGFAAADTNFAPTVAGQDPRALGVGIRYNF